MKNGIPEFDHLMCGVKDPAHANQAFEKLGFTVSPLSDTGLGVSNRCIILTPATTETANYIELMGVTDPENARPEVMALISGDEGIKQLITYTPDARGGIRGSSNRTDTSSGPCWISSESGLFRPERRSI